MAAVIIGFALNTVFPSAREGFGSAGWTASLTRDAVFVLCEWYNTVIQRSVVPAIQVLILS